MGIVCKPYNLILYVCYELDTHPEHMKQHVGNYCVNNSKTSLLKKIPSFYFRNILACQISVLSVIGLLHVIIHIKRTRKTDCC